MTIEDFNERVQDVFGGRLRARRSEVSEDLIFIEQRVGRGVFTGLADIPAKNKRQALIRRDLMIRVRDGYSFVMEVRMGNRMACGKCHLTVRVPELHSAEVKCECGWSGISAFFPLSDILIDYLKKIDPNRDGHKEAVRDADISYRRHLRSKDRDLDNNLHDGLWDEAIRQIPKVGYTGKENAWIRE